MVSRFLGLKWCLGILVFGFVIWEVYECVSVYNIYFSLILYEIDYVFTVFLQYFKDFEQYLLIWLGFLYSASICDKLGCGFMA